MLEHYLILKSCTILDKGMLIKTHKANRISAILFLDDDLIHDFDAKKPPKVSNTLENADISRISDDFDIATKDVVTFASRICE